MNCRTCGQPNRENATFCRHCGAPLSLAETCPRCGAVVAADDQYCDACGATLRVAAPPALAATDQGLGPAETGPQHAWEGNGAPVPEQTANTVPVIQDDEVAMGGGLPSPQDLQVSAADSGQTQFASLQADARQDIAVEKPPPEESDVLMVRPELAHAEMAAAAADNGVAPQPSRSEEVGRPPSSADSINGPPEARARLSEPFEEPSADMPDESQFPPESRPQMLVDALAAVVLGVALLALVAVLMPH